MEEMVSASATFKAGSSLRVYRFVGEEREERTARRDGGRRREPMWSIRWGGGIVMVPVGLWCLVWRVFGVQCRALFDDEV
jgi:hypothetical protein